MPQVYKIWRVDCDCGSVIDYGEDTGTVPEACEDCGAEIEEPTEG